MGVTVYHYQIITTGAKKLFNILLLFASNSSLLNARVVHEFPSGHEKDTLELSLVK